VADDVSKTLHAVGLGSIAQELFLFALGLGPAPRLPAGVQGRTIEAGAAAWQEREGRHAQDLLDQSQDALDALEYVRTTRGRPRGELKALVDRAGGVGNHPELLELMARIGGRLKHSPDYQPLMDAIAQARAQARAGRR
jgi:hypothetical protein